MSWKNSKTHEIAVFASKRPEASLQSLQ